MKRTIERGCDILKKLEWDRIQLEYGIPLSTIVYQLIRTFRAKDVADMYGEVTEVADLVEQEARAGRYGAFGLRYVSSSSDDIIEVWSWDNSNTKGE
jgi:hypothetical protein